jgi:hypothetical protein
MHQTVQMITLLAVMSVVVTAKKVPRVNFHFDPADTRIVTIKAADFRERVVDPTLPIAAHFYDPRSKVSEDFGPEVLKAAEALQGLARFVAMDGSSDDGKALSQMFGFASLPATLLFNPEMLPVQGGEAGQYMKVPVMYQGPRTAEGLVRFVLEFMAGHDIERVEDLVDYKDFIDRQKHTGLPKVLLVTSSNLTSPLFKAASHEYRYGASFGVVHSANLAEAAAAARGDEITTLKGELLAQLGLGAKPADDALPALVAITGNDAPEMRIVGDSAFGLSDLKTWLSGVAWPAEKRREMMSYFLEDAAQRLKREEQEAKMNKALPPVQAVDACTWEEHCVKRTKGICAAVFVENPDDEAGLKWLDAASRQMAQRVSTPSRLVVVGAYQQPALASFFGAAEQGFPTVVFINPARRMYYKLIGSFSEKGVVSFFADKVAKGKGITYDPSKVPAFVEASMTAGQPEEEGDDIVVNEDL